MNLKIHFYIRTDRPAKDGSVAIYLLILISKNQRLRLNTGKFIPLKKQYRKFNSDQLKESEIKRKEDLYCWDVNRERATNQAENHNSVNLHLDNEKTKINQIILKFEMLNKPLTIQSFKNAYLRPNGANTFYEYFNHELEKRKHLLSLGTFIGYSTTVSKINKFKPNLTLADIDYKFLTQLENYMLKPISEKGLGNHPLEFFMAMIKRKLVTFKTNRWAGLDR
ncbi:MAG TPA: phage integrase SAM-like domain-containing protein [Bacteroidia bacterium]|jgi:hypothetical protein|nr:phage integrase SAM-like domain-containing protein [Bacteroidia bacterium]